MKMKFTQSAWWMGLNNSLLHSKTPAVYMTFSRVQGFIAQVHTMKIPELTLQDKKINIELDALLSELHTFQSAFNRALHVSQSADAPVDIYLALIAIENRLHALKQLISSEHHHWVFKPNTFFSKPDLHPIYDQFLGLCRSIRQFSDPFQIKTMSKLDSLMKNMDKNDERIFMTILSRAGKIPPLIHQYADLKKIGAYLSEDQKNVTQSVQTRLFDEDRRLEMSHILGLKNHATASKSFGRHEGFHIKSANLSSKMRFEQLMQKENAPLHLDLDYQFKVLCNFGSYQGMHCGWYRHAFSFFQVNEGDKTHILFLNKGEKHRDGHVPNLMVFTVPTDSVNDLLQELGTTLKTEDRTQIAAFIEKRLQPFYNEPIARKLNKSKQKVGNCTIANSNMAWHIALASEYMQQHHVDFLSAYQKTLPQYKALRQQDRASAFVYLWTTAKEYLYVDPNDFYEDVMTVLWKHYQKNMDGNKGDRIVPILDALYQDDPDHLNELFYLLWNASFIQVSQQSPVDSRAKDNALCEYLNFILLYVKNPTVNTLLQLAFNMILPARLLPKSYAQEHTSDTLYQEEIERKTRLTEAQFEWSLQIQQWMRLHQLDPEGDAQRSQMIKKMVDDGFQSAIQRSERNESFGESRQPISFTWNPHFATVFLPQYPHYLEELVKKNPKNLFLVRIVAEVDPNLMRFADVSAIQPMIKIYGYKTLDFLPEDKAIALIQAYPQDFINAFQHIDFNQPGLLEKLDDHVLFQIFEASFHNFIPEALAHRMAFFCIKQSGYDEPRQKILLDKIFSYAETKERKSELINSVLHDASQLDQTHMKEMIQSLRVDDTTMDGLKHE